MAMVPSLLCIPNYLVAPVTILRTLAAVTTHCHKSKRFRPSICNFHHKYNTRAIASDSTSSIVVTSTVSTQRYSEYGRLLPCPAESFQPRIKHLVVREEWTILDFITKALDLPPLCYEIDWRSRIIAVTESYVVLNKPAGTSVGGTTDNIEATCANFATRALELTTPLMTTHQIDNCTEGCVMLARTKDYCSVFHRKIREKQVKKLYLALAAAYVPCGVMTHYMRPLRMAPKVVSKDVVKGWNMCQLEVLECRKVPWPNDLVERSYGIEDVRWPNKEFAYECKINLLTGRTHQIRAQLAACGAPIVGDSMYMPAAMAELANPGVNPFGEYKMQFESEAHREQAAVEWAAKHGKEPG